MDAAASVGVAEKIEVVECRLDKEALSTADDAPPVHVCQRALRSCGLDDAPIGVAFGTDAGPFSLAGIPSVVLGPGSVAKAHTEDEFVPLDELEAMRRFFVQLLTTA
jgi:acetylornithine deacetylase